MPIHKSLDSDMNTWKQLDPSIATSPNPSQARRIEEQLRTPSVSTMSSTATPQPKPETNEEYVDDIREAFARRNFEKRRKAFQNMRQLERVAIKGCIEKFIKSNKGSMTAEHDRWTALQDQREKKLREREANGKGSLRQDFKDLYDEQFELDYLKKSTNFAIYLGDQGWTTRRADEDDEEPLPQNQIKQELVELSLANLQSFRARATELAVEHQSSVTDEREKVAVVSCVSRGFAITGSELDADDHDNVSLTARRAWRWINGKMVVWPPFDRSTAIAEMGIGMSKKRAVEDAFDADRRAVKRARC